MSRNLKLRGMAPLTHDGYLRKVRKLACYYNSPPDQLTEQQVGQYLPHLVENCRFAPGSIGVAYSRIKYFSTITEPRNWEVLKKFRRPKQKTLPAAFTRDEVADQIDPAVWQQHWVVDVAAVGDGRAVLKYLAPYVYRVAISNSRIVAVDESSATYRVTPTIKRDPNGRECCIRGV